jgi:hypothetical protein
MSSNCIRWEGPDIACLNIVTGQNLTELEEAMAEKICKLVENDTAVLNTVLCGDFIALMAGKDKTVANLLQVMLTYDCSLKVLIDKVAADLKEFMDINVDLKCLKKATDTGHDPCDPTKTVVYTLEMILQLIIDFICALQTQLNNLIASLPTLIQQYAGNMLAGAMKSCQTGRISVTGTGASTVVNFKGFVPPFAAIPYYGPLTNFDSSGKGLTNTPVCGWYLCNGANGTPDLRGVVPFGATSGIPGGSSIPSFADPATYGYPQMAINDTGGVSKVLLTGNQSGVGAHSHGNVTGSFTFSIDYQTIDWNDYADGAGGTNGRKIFSRFPVTKTSAPKTVNLSMPVPASSGSSASESHENRMPFKACAFIMMIN